MSLSNDEIQSAKNFSDRLYLYIDHATSGDLIKIINQSLFSSSGISTFIKIIHDDRPELLTDEVIYTILNKTLSGCASAKTSLKLVLEAFTTNNVTISGAVVAKLAFYTQDIYTILDTLKPKLTYEDIVKILVHTRDRNVLTYIINQLTPEEDFKFIAEQDKLIEFLYTHNKQLATNVIQKLIASKDFDFIIEKSAHCYAWGYGILFSTDLVEKMANLCLQEHKEEVIFSLPAGDFRMLAENSPEQIKSAIVYLLDTEQEQKVVSSKLALAFIAKQATDLIGRITQKKVALQNVTQEYALLLLDSMQLPDADLEFVYIEKCRDATTSFPAREKLSPETLTYIDTITSLKIDASKVKFLTPRVLKALINCKFTDRVNWYKLMKQILITCPDLDKTHIQKMLNVDNKVDTLIKKHWKGNLTQMKIQKYFTDKTDSMTFWVTQKMDAIRDFLGQKTRG